MSLNHCHGYTQHELKCDTCDFKVSIDSITARNTRATLGYEDGDPCPEVTEVKSMVDGKEVITEVACDGSLIESSYKVSAEEHRQSYLDYHADDEYDRDR